MADDSNFPKDENRLPWLPVVFVLVGGYWLYHVVTRGLPYYFVAFAGIVCAVGLIQGIMEFVPACRAYRRLTGLIAFAILIVLLAINTVVLIATNVVG